jgi:phage shock protein PspC (stress-responsive transcriptional regulator)
MNKVITINLNGRAYQLEESGYEALRKYLDQASAKLHDNPDKDEIMADFEQAIADKCDECLQGHKNVVGKDEIESIIQKMGPVENGTEKNAGAPTAGTHGNFKRLYQIREGAWISGVCTGLAAYFNLDVSWVRVAFIALLALTHGFGFVLYVILMIVVPVARTDEEKERARGAMPFNAHDFIEQAKEQYAEFQKAHPHVPAAPPIPGAPEDPHNREAWRKWKQEMRDWKRDWRADMRRERMARRGRHDWTTDWNAGPMMNVGTGFFRFVMVVILIGLTMTCAFAIASVVQRGTIFGYAVAPGHPLWVTIVFIFALFYVIATPFKLFMKNARPWRWGHYSFFSDVVQSVLFVFAIYLVIALGRELFPVVNEAWSTLVMYLKGAWW